MLKKIDNQMIAGVLLIAFALILLAGILAIINRNGSTATVENVPLNPTETKSSADGAVAKVEDNQQVIPTEPANEVPIQDAVAPSPESVPEGWLPYVNSIRTMAGIPRVAEDSGLSNGARLHAIYVVANDNFDHRESPNLPQYTPEGDAAAQNGLIFATSNTSAFYKDSITFWASGPFHLVPMLNPRLDKMGYGSFVDASDSGVRMSGILNLGPRDSHGDDKSVYPVMYPGNGQTTPVLSQTLPEWPDAMGHCGWSRPVGAPIVLMIGTGNQTPNVNSYSVSQNGAPIEVCMFNETNFSGSDGSQQTTGRRILNSLDAVVLIPREPLKAGSTYDVSLTVNGESYNWSFAAR